MINKKIPPKIESYFDVDMNDKRLNDRLLSLVKKMSTSTEKSILGLSKNHYDAKGYYRMLSNEKFDTVKIINSSRSAALSWMQGKVLLIQDTTEINLVNHKKTEDLGYSSRLVHGVNLHTCLSVSPEGVPYGIIDQSRITRPEAKSSLSKEEKKALPIEEKESYRWIETLKNSTAQMPEDVQFITVCDREGDIYELYSEALTQELDFIIRVAHNRRTQDKDKVLNKIRTTESCLQYVMETSCDSRQGKSARKVDMEIAFCTADILKPTHIKNDDIPSSLTINLVRASEMNPVGKDKIEWILATSLPLPDAAAAKEIVECYIQRWKIERFHYVLKSGFKAEEIQQRTLPKVEAMLLLYSMIATYIMTLTFLGRKCPDVPCDLLLDEDEWKILYRIYYKTKKAPQKPYSIADAVQYLGEYGSYKRLPSDGPPGLKSIWQGLFLLYHAIEVLMGQG